jgi:NAD(P)H-hydrate epimerase
VTQQFIARTRGPEIDMFTLTRDEVRELDRRAINDFGLPGAVLMENAGRGCAELLMQLNPERKPTVILCGPGNNGGDGFVIARHLDNRGWTASVIFIADRVPTHGEAAVNFQVLQKCGLAPHSTDGQNPDLLVELLETLCAPSRAWIVDALFGTGLSRPLTTPYDRVVSALLRLKCPVLAVDIPSGLDCDTGEPLGPTVCASHTATFVAAKRGFLNPNSRQWTGEVHVIDIGAPRVLVEEYRKRANA